MEIAQLSIMESIIRLLAACILGGIIGFEREKTNRPAGLRTHLIVCMGSCLSMITSLHIFQMFYTVSNADPARLSQGVISGIGFLGAGTIIREGNKVKGLTTAASIWGVACIGLSIGMGLYFISIVSVVLIIIILKWLNRVESRFIQYAETFHISIKIQKNTAGLDRFHQIINESKSNIMNLQVKTDMDTYDLIISDLRSPSEMQKQDILQELLEDQRFIEFIVKEI